mgnify:CR=1 FL=1
MTKNYTKPIVTIDSGMAEGVYAASGATKGTLNVTYYGVWDRWGTNGGKGLAQASWSDLDGTITLNINFNDTVDSIETDDASVQKSWSGKLPPSLCKHSNQSADHWYSSEPWNQHRRSAAHWI